MTKSHALFTVGPRKFAACSLVAIGIFLWAELTRAQNCPTEKFGFARVVEEAGWRVPEISSGILKEKKMQIRDGMNVTESRYVPKVRTDLTALTYYMDEKRDLYQNTKHLEVQSFSTYEAAGKIYAIRTDLLQFGISELAGRAYFGERMQFAFIDTDGDGKFETREYGDFRSVPAWVKEIGNKD